MSRHRAEDVPTSPAEARRLPGLQTILTLAAACAALFWVARATRDALEPANYLVRMLRNGDAEQKIEAAKGLGEDEAGPAFRPKAAEALIAALADPNEEVAAVASHALASLIQVERDADRAATWNDSLAAGLRDPRPMVRRYTAVVFPSDGLPRSAPRSTAASDALASLVDDPAEEVRPVAINALALKGTGEVGLRALTKALESDPSTANRAAAARALGRYPDHGGEASAALFRGLKSDRPEVRAACHMALGPPGVSSDLKPSAALVPDLIAALAAPDRTARAHAAILLARIGPEGVVAVPALIAMLDEPDAGPGAADLRPILVPLPVLAAEALGRIAPGTTREREAAEALTAVLRDPQGPGPGDGAAALALGRFPGDWACVAVPRLVATLESRHPSRAAAEVPFTLGWDTGSAIKALGDLAPGTFQEAAAVAALIRALDSGFKINAAETLGRFGAAARSALPRLREMAKLDDAGFRRDLEDVVRQIEAAGGSSAGTVKDRP